MRKLACLFILVCSIPAFVAANDFVEGQHYEVIAPPLAAGAEGAVEIIELFWYGCPHCFDFEPRVSAWASQLPTGVSFRRVPAVFARNWELHARAYYAAEQLGVLEAIHKPLFDAIHVEKRELFTQADLAKFCAEHGVKVEDFNAAFDSFEVDGKTRKAIAATRNSGIGGVPAMIVNGKYRVSAQLAGDYETLLKVVEFLAAKEQAR
jgi:thiol:disulfide interchange protein DsbA